MAEYIERGSIEYPYMSMSMWGINSATCKAYNEGVKATEDAIKAMHTADVVEVVRCKDCKRCYEKRTKRNKQLMRFCMRMDGNEYQVNANDFCSYGKRKGEGDV